MLAKESGFTLIELVIVIVILGILAVIAIPKYVDLTGAANAAATNGVAGALASASAINYGARKAGSGGIAIANCQTVASLLAGGVLPTPSSGSYAITSLALTADTTSVCTLTGPGATTVTFAATGVS